MGLSVAPGSATIAGLSTYTPSGEYVVRCPHCRAQALAHMVPRGTQGTHREVYVHYAAGRISCTRCGEAYPHWLRMRKHRPELLRRLLRLRAQGPEP